MKYVLYHGNCYDGFGAAYAAWKHLGNEAKYIPVTYGAELPDLTGASHVYILDFSYPYQTLEGIAEHMPLTLIDHHKTAKENLQDWWHHNATVIIDMAKSGALLTWEYFHRYPAESPSDPGLPVPAPLLIQHISDRDLWEFKLEGTKAVHKALVSLPMDFGVWDSLDVEVLKKDGVILERLHDQLVKNICEKAWTTDIDGHKVPTVNTSIAWSEVGDYMAKENPTAPFVASFTVMKNSVMWSLRSRGDFDVSAVAKKFGGGGHKNAAGFKTARF